ncbi:hypothetical protein BASA50_002374 [Batrachochytrium salamandrivorans]|uniref:Uncharacterized protein n=1 Tax=Batrachochytrium salamandrivorans TaxID=1357716 RepID=A0ABQ8FLI7_9FUNG|nr:hypothetical protein BASA50_002374 [Batrachochytrium salamandrivorans]
MYTIGSLLVLIVHLQGMAVAVGTTSTVDLVPTNTAIEGNLPIDSTATAVTSRVEDVSSLPSDVSSLPPSASSLPSDVSTAAFRCLIATSKCTVTTSSAPSLPPTASSLPPAAPSPPPSAPSPPPNAPSLPPNAPSLPPAAPSPPPTASPLPPAAPRTTFVIPGRPTPSLPPPRPTIPSRPVPRRPVQIRLARENEGCSQRPCVPGTICFLGQCTRLPGLQIGVFTTIQTQRSPRSSNQKDPTTPNSVSDKTPQDILMSGLVESASLPLNRPPAQSSLFPSIPPSGPTRSLACRSISQSSGTLIFLISQLVFSFFAIAML